MKRRWIEASGRTCFLLAALAAATVVIGRQNTVPLGLEVPINGDSGDGSAPDAASPTKTSSALTRHEIEEAFGALRPDDGQPPQTKVFVDANAKGGTDELYRSFAKALAAENPSPADRDEDFVWVKLRDCRVTGWEVSIVKAEPSTGGWHVIVCVRPTVSKNRGGVRVTDDHRFEAYHFADGKLRYVAGIKPQFGLETVEVQHPD